MIYKENFKIGLKDIDKNNLVKNRAILEILENIGAYHSDEVKYGANEIEINRNAWVLLDWKLKVIKRLKYGQTLNVHTWGRDVNKFFTYRDFEIYNEDNELCVIATSKWALVNIDTKKLVRLDSEIMDRYKIEEKSVFSERNLGKIQIPNEFSSSLDYSVIRKDIDINKHMHNLYYLDLAYEVMPEEIYENRPFNNVKINYKKEIKLRR